MAWQVKKVISPFYKTILSVFKYYCLTSSQSIRGAFSIQPNQFGKMMQDAEFAGNFISVEEIGKIFVMVNFETDKVKKILFCYELVGTLGIVTDGGDVLFSRYAVCCSETDTRLVNCVFIRTDFILPVR